MCYHCYRIGEILKDYIVLTINQNKLIFNHRVINEEEKRYLNKDYIYKDSFYYTQKKFKKNFNNILLILSKYNLDELTIQCLTTFKYIAFITKALDIQKLNFNFKSSIALNDYKLFMSLHLKEITCYYMPKIIKRQFETKNINVITKCNTIISEKFLKSQKLVNQDELYYKKSINLLIDYPELINDLKDFFSINYDIKEIHIYIYSKELINSVVNLLKNDESRNVIIYLHQSADKGNFITNNFDWLKSISDSCKRDKCEFRIIYSNSYFKHTLFKQLTFNNLKLLIILITYVFSVSLVIYFSYSYVKYINKQEPTIQKEEEKEESIETHPTIDHSKYNITYNYNKLIKYNKDTIGYIKIKNTKISYPILQTTNNYYFKNKDFYNHDSLTGWIYLDYRVDKNNLKDNTIIYGKDMYDGSMFTTLKDILTTSYRIVNEDLLVDIYIKNIQHRYKIFSGYKTKYNTEDLKVKFNTLEEKKDFIQTIKEKSIFESEVTVDETSNILTLTTFTGDNKDRIVIHAVEVK